MNGLSLETIRALLARRNPQLTQALVEGRYISPDQASQAMLPAPSLGAAVLNGQSTPVASDMVLGPSSLPPIGAQQAPITPYRQPDNFSPPPAPNAVARAAQPYVQTMPYRRHPLQPGPSSESASTASINDQPVGTQSDTVLGPPDTPQVAPGFQRNPLPNFGQIGQALMAPTNPNAPPVDYTSSELNPEVMGQQQAAAARQAPPQIAPLAPETNKPPTPAQQADEAVKGKIITGGGPNDQPVGQGGFSPPPMRTLPARTITTVDPGVFREERGALEQERAGRVGEAQAEVGANQKLAESYGNQAGQEYINQVQAESKARNIRWMGEQHANEMEKDRKELEQSGKPDYNRLFRGRPVIGLLAAIAQGFGAAGAALTHGPNSAAQIIQDRIDRDVGEQRADYERKKESAAAKNSIFAEKMKLLGDPNAAEEAAKAHGYMAAGLIAKREATLANSPVLEARATTIDGIMGQKSAEKTAGMQQRLQASMVGGFGAGGVDSKLYVPRAQAVARTEKEADEFRKDGAAYGTLQTVGQKALALRQQLSLAHPYDAYKIHQQLKALQDEAQHAIQETSGFKRLSDKDAQINVGQLGSITAFTPGTSERLQAFLADKQREEQQQYEAGGLSRARSGYRYDLHGQLLPAVSLTGQDYAPPPTLRPSGAVQ
jgi:hypothetical protein